MDGKWSWPKSQLAIEREQVPPHDRIDVDALREVLAGLDERQGDRLIELIAESVVLEDAPILLESGLPAPKEIGTRLLYLRTTTLRQNCRFFHEFKWLSIASLGNFMS